MSAFATSRLKITSPSGALRLRLRDRLLRCRFCISKPCRSPPMPSLGSTPGGASILRTSAPKSAKIRTQVGPARTRVRSSKRRLDRALEARGGGIDHSECYELASAPHSVGQLDDASELAPLVIEAQGISTHARRKAALRADTEVIERDVAGRFIDASAQQVKRLELGPLAADQPEDHGLVLRYVTQRRQAARALALVFEEERVYVGLAKELFGDRVIAAFRHPVALVVALAEVKPDGHARRPRRDAEVDGGHIGLQQSRRLQAGGVHLRSD